LYIKCESKKIPVNPDEYLHIRRRNRQKNDRSRYRYYLGAFVQPASITSLDQPKPMLRLVQQATQGFVKNIPFMWWIGDLDHGSASASQ
jgi:hypothetical protein